MKITGKWHKNHRLFSVVYRRCAFVSIGEVDSTIIKHLIISCQQNGVKKGGVIKKTYTPPKIA
jgi:hypothetical protein